MGTTAYCYPPHRQAVRRRLDYLHDAGDLLYAEHSIEQALLQWGIALPSNVGIFSPKQAISTVPAYPPVR